MSVYNGEEYLKEAVESILSQTFSNFEFIIINDGSTDGTSAILSGYDDDRLKLIEQRNRGLTKSLNKGILMAQGKYIARMDADDIAFPQKLKKQIEFMENNPEIGLIGTACHTIDHKGEIIKTDIFPLDNERIRKTLIKYNPFLHSSIMVRKKVFDKVGLYNEDMIYAQDYELYFRISKCYKMANLPDVLMKRRCLASMVSLKNEHLQKKIAISLRKEAIREKLYPWWCVIYLMRPYIAVKTPDFIRKFLRKYILDSKKVYQTLER